ncbi:MAG: hypothetical protein ACRYF9_22650 [Janthinobacterium lividum]|jgi:hypothetical protein|uniref:hypothetical protein n=1 Tax=Pseudomonas TaxID=286 RepID=UPI001CFA24AC|nr:MULTISPECIES: hypothetical protein [Pseudomonas]
MATFALCWIAALVVAFFMTIGLIRGGKRHEDMVMVPIKMDSDADPRRRRQH